MEGGGDADVAEEGVGGLLAEGGLVGFPAEAAGHESLMFNTPDLVEAAGDLILVLVFWVG